MLFSSGVIQSATNFLDTEVHEYLSVRLFKIAQAAFVALFQQPELSRTDWPILHVKAVSECFSMLQPTTAVSSFWRGARIFFSDDPKLQRQTRTFPMVASGASLSLYVVSLFMRCH